MNSTPNKRGVLGAALVVAGLCASVLLARVAALPGQGPLTVAAVVGATVVIVLSVVMSVPSTRATVALGTAPLHLMVISMFIEGVGVGPLSSGRLIAGVAVAVIGIRMLTRWAPMVPPAWTWLPAMLVAAWTVASGLWAIDRGGWMFAVGQMALALAFFFAFAVLLDDVGEVRPLLRTFALAALAAAVLGMTQYLVVADHRADGLQGDANIYALYQVTALPAVWALFRTSSSVRAKVFWAAATLPLVMSVLASGSRGGLITMAITVLVAVVYLVPRGGGRRLWAFAGVSLLIACVGVVALLTNERLQVDRVLRDRASGRLDIWLVAWHQWVEHPLSGIGAGSFKPISLELLSSIPGVRIYKGHLFELSGIEVHNLYLQALAETGLIGLILLGAAAAASIAGLSLAIRHWPRRIELRALPPMLWTFLAASVSLSLPNGKPFWIIGGVAAALMAIRQSQRGWRGNVPSDARSSEDQAVATHRKLP